MRRFHSYGPIQNKLHYYAPRIELIENAKLELIGDPDGSGHYVTVWAPRQTGKSWVMRQVIRRIKDEDEFEVGVISLQLAKDVKDEEEVLEIFVDKLQIAFQREFPKIQRWKEISSLFSAAYFSKPLILIIDEFDALQEELINRFANTFRDMYLERMDQSGVPSGEKNNLLHGLALIGVRSVLGIENVSGSPFNTQRSIHIPNLSREEVVQIFQDYQDESGKSIETDVVERIYYEMQGQPGLTCWFGELLTEARRQHDGGLVMDDFKYVYSRAQKVEPNNNILNIVSKARKEEYKPLVLEMFQIGEKLSFSYDDPIINYLYMNGVVSYEEVLDAMGDHQQYLKFPSPFVQKRLFNTFSHELFSSLKRLYDPFTDLSNTITDTHLDIEHIIRLYEDYLHKNSDWLLKNAPRRKTDEHIYEAVYHFNLYMYLFHFLQRKASVVPEFPTGNGKIDLVIHHPKNTYLLEVKSFTNRQVHQEALEQAAEYAQQLVLSEAWLITFIETMNEDQRASLEITYHDATTGITVHPIFVKMQ